MKDYKILLDCLEKFVFYNKPEIYFEFIKVVLDSDLICKIYKKEKLRKLYLLLCDIKPETYKQEKYQKRYLYKEELDVIYKQKKLKEELQKKKEMQEAEKYIDSKFMEIEEKNNCENLYTFCHNYDYTYKYGEVATNLVKKYIFLNDGKIDLNTSNKDIGEISNFIKLLDFLIQKEKLTSTEFAKITLEYTK